MMFAEIKEKLKDKTVGIAGAGGLGSNCAVALARSGVGKLIAVDFDVVEISNLNRQYFFYDQIGQRKVLALRENLKRINPEVEVEVHHHKLDSDDIKRIYSGCDVIVEAFDLASMKQMIIETVLGEMPEMPIVAGSGMAGWGDSESIKVTRLGKLVVCGDMNKEVSPEHPPLAPRVGIVSNMMANQVLEILLGVEEY